MIKEKTILKLSVIDALNLTTKEKAVFGALEIQKMAGTATQIARRAKVGRSTTIYILERFLLRKIVRKMPREKHTHWTLIKSFTIPASEIPEAPKPPADFTNLTRMLS